MMASICSTGMIFIDNPVGAGFSFTGTGNGYCTNTHDCVARNLYSALQQFYKMFDKLQGNQLWITGESYGGHYVPAIGAYIHDQNEAIARGLNRSNVALPLAGIAVGECCVSLCESVFLVFISSASVCCTSQTQGDCVMFSPSVWWMFPSSCFHTHVQRPFLCVLVQRI